MNTKEILKDIGTRTNGDIYLGVVGPVRTGKSTFIKKFMEVLIIPNIEDEFVKNRTVDELPQAGQGRTIMTMEPKFVPNSAASIKVEDNFNVKVRLVDCVGYVFEDAKGYKEDDGIRMVRTPWFSEPIPFDEAAKVGTQKVIQEHSTIGIVVTTDGSIGDIPRHSYIESECKVIEELQGLGKPFIVIVNSKNPNSEEARKVVEDIKNKYDVCVIAQNVEMLNSVDAEEILKEALNEFPLANIDISLPKWVAVLEETHWLKNSINNSVELAMKEAKKIRDVQKIGNIMKENDNITNYEICDVNMANGYVNVNVEVNEELYENIMKEIIGFEIEDKSELMELITEYAKMKKYYDVLKPALESANATGYGYASPTIDDIVVEKPELVKANGRYGVKVKAHAPSWHIIKVDINTTFEPIIGNKEQSEYLVQTLCDDYDKNPILVFDSQVFGRKMGDVIKDGINSKLTTLPEPTKAKLQQLVKNLANKGNLIAIVF